MPTVLTHAVAGAAIAQVFAPAGRRSAMTTIAAVCAILPDADTVGLRLGIPYGSMWGHRGFTHSVLFAALTAVVVVTCFWRRAGPSDMTRALLCIFVATASHGVLDAFTDGGLGVAFFAPFDGTRYFFPVRPIRVSPIGVARFFSRTGINVLSSEMLWVWIPSGVLALFARALR
jgi:inner membrane protein